MSEPASAHTGALADLFVTNGMALFTSPGKSHGGRGFRQVSVLSEVTGGVGCLNTRCNQVCAIPTVVT